MFKSASKLVSIILTLVLILGLATLLSPFMVLKCFCYIWLRTKHRDDFGGFLSGVSTGFALHRNEQIGLINIALVDYNDSPKEVFKSVKVGVEKTHKYFYHLGSTIEESWGYFYFLKNQINAEDCVSTLSLRDDKEMLSFDDILDYFDATRITNDKRLWEVVLINQPVWFNKKKTYAIYIRVNHTISDGFSLLSMLSKYINAQHNRHKNISKIDLNNYKTKFSLDNCYMEDNLMNFCDDELKENSRQYTCCYIEDQPDLGSKIKLISKKFNVRYSEVLIAGLIKSISSLLDEKNVECSGKLQLAITGSADIQQIQDLLSGKYEIKSLSNSFFSVLIVASKCDKGSTRSSVLMEISRKNESAKKAMNPLMGLALCEYVTSLLPASLSEENSINWNKKFSLIFSNLVEYGQTNTFNQNMEAFFSTVTIPANKTIFASTGTYAGRFIMTISGRYEFLQSRKDVQYIMDGTMEYVEGLFQEIIDDKLA